MIGNRLDLHRSRPVPLSRRAPDGRNHLCLRGGMTLFEVLAAVAVLGVLLIACAQMLAVMTVQQQAVRNRRAAVQMAQNAMERCFAAARGQTEADKSDEIAAEVTAAGMLRDARVEIALEDAGDPRGVRTVRVAVAWREGAEEPERVVRLTGWRYRVRQAEEAARPSREEQPQAARP
jgi:prepilin-type N-terminal cleavage/methylation domain-containing protein